MPAQHPPLPLVDVTTENLARTGFFCFMSKKKHEGYRRKQAWLDARLTEGLRLRMLPLPERGFIEYLPGGMAWRAIEAEGYMLIHCLWVVGQSKGKGFGRRLLEACVEDARQAGMKGVVMMTTRRVWLAHDDLFAASGFRKVDEIDPYALWMMPFGSHEPPRFAGDFEAKAQRLGEGLTVVRSPQCPYLVDATMIALQAAEKKGIPHRIVELESRRDVMTLSPTPYGVFALVLDGRLLASHYLQEKELLPLLVR